MAFGRGFNREKGKKYNNTKVEFDGIKFDSKKEMQRYLALKDAQEKGLISDLKLQVRFELIPAVKEEYVEHLKTKDRIKTRTLQLPITYTCDFLYIKDGETIVEDVKASPKMLPKEYTLKKKMMFALKGIKIKEVYKSNEII
jgi:hypothetical protein